MPQTRRNLAPQNTNPEPMKSATVEALMAQHVADSIANLETNRNIGLGGTEGEISYEENRGPSTACSYKDFMNCKLKSFHGNEGVVGLSRWIDKVESEIEIRFYAEICKVKFAFCNLTDASMSW